MKQHIKRKILPFTRQLPDVYGNPIHLNRQN